MAKGKYVRGPNSYIEENIFWQLGKDPVQSPKGLYGWGNVSNRTHSRPNGIASTGARPTWGHGYLVWFRLLYCCSNNTMIN